MHNNTIMLNFSMKAMECRKKQTGYGQKYYLIDSYITTFNKTFLLSILC